MEIPFSDALDIDCHALNLLEFQEIIQSLKNNKVAGPDIIPAEIIKGDLEAFPPLITMIWNDKDKVI